MKTVTHQGISYPCPFAELLRPLTPEERGNLELSIADLGILEDVVVYDGPRYGPRCIIDGINRLEIAAAHNLPAPIRIMGKWKDEPAEKMFRALNVERRMLTPSEQQAVRQKRIERVAEARSDGKSLRAIAQTEGVSQMQVRRDLEKATETGVSVDVPERITGLDGREYAVIDEPEEEPEDAPAPVCSSRPLPKWMKPGSNRDPDHPYVEILDQIARLNGLFTKAIREDGNERLVEYLTWHKLVIYRAVVIENGEKKAPEPKFRGFAGLRRLVALAGKRGRKLTRDELAAKVKEASRQEIEE